MWGRTPLPSPSYASTDMYICIHAFSAFLVQQVFSIFYYYAQQEFIGCLPAEAAEGWFNLKCKLPYEPSCPSVGWLVDW